MQMQTFKKITRVTRRTLPFKLVARRPFNGPSCHADEVSMQCSQCQKVSTLYLVYSFETLMYSFCEECEYECRNKQYYNATTSWLQRQIAAVFPEKTAQ